jgi:hypothetical protein
MLRERPEAWEHPDTPPCSGSIGRTPNREGIGDPVTGSIQGNQDERELWEHQERSDNFGRRLIWRSIGRNVGAEGYLGSNREYIIVSPNFLIRAHDLNANSHGMSCRYLRVARASSCGSCFRTLPVFLLVMILFIKETYRAIRISCLRQRRGIACKGVRDQASGDHGGEPCLLPPLF